MFFFVETFSTSLATNDKGSRRRSNRTAQPAPVVIGPVYCTERFSYYCSSEDRCASYRDFCNAVSCTQGTEVMYPCDGGCKKVEQCERAPTFAGELGSPVRGIRPVQTGFDENVFVLHSPAVLGMGTVALNASAVTFHYDDYPLTVPSDELAEYLRYILAMSHNRMFIHAEVVPLVSRSVWDLHPYVAPDAQVSVLNMGEAPFCKDATLDCARLLPLGCDAEAPGYGRKVGELCALSCGLCPKFAYRILERAADVCAVEEDVAMCVALLSSSVLCKGRVLQNVSYIESENGLFSRTACYLVQYCPAVVAAVEKACATVPCLDGGCTDGNYFLPTQVVYEAGLQMTYCADEMTGVALPHTTVVASRGTELQCKTPPTGRRQKITSEGYYLPPRTPLFLSVYATVADLQATEDECWELGLATPFQCVCESKGGAMRMTLWPSTEDISVTAEVIGGVHPSEEVLGMVASIFSVQTEKRVVQMLAGREPPPQVSALPRRTLFTQVSGKTPTSLHAHIPDRILITFTTRQASFTLVNVPITLNITLLTPAPPGGFSWGLYEPRPDGKCPIPDDAVYDPFRIGLTKECLVSTSRVRAVQCRVGDLTRKHGRLSTDTVVTEYYMTLDGVDSVQGKVLVVYGKEVHCVALQAGSPSEAKEATFLEADFNNVWAEKAEGVSLSGHLRIAQTTPSNVSLLSITLHSAETLCNLSYHISTRHITEYTQSCLAEYTANDVFDPYGEGSVSRCDAGEYSCPLGVLTSYLKGAECLPVNGTAPGNNRDAPVSYVYSAPHPFLDVFGAGRASLRGNAVGGHTVVLLQNGRVVACAPLFGAGETMPARVLQDAGDDNSYVPLVVSLSLSLVCVVLLCFYVDRRIRSLQEQEG